MAQQLGFDLPVRVALGRDDFLVAPSNAVALSMVDAWRSWPNGKLALTGPSGAGKTHLAHVWAADSGARIVAADTLNTTSPDALFDAPLAVEDVDRIARNSACQTALFHIHNALQTAGHPLLMTGENAPNLWRLSLPDLQSRVDAAGHAALDAPDDSLLAAVLAKLFADRQLTPRPDVIPYLVTHMERSFAAARTVVAAIDARSLAQKKPITRALAVACLDNPR
ncbi:DnaA ATPase domain-containing protein [Tateyamaria omphalii]|uniref:Chromosomal replication initiator DnaA n=1 Tax=Tateyamaria omphalii TaxID=299262 RepID=A0A1P8MSI7_9RHOB|nr:DnaA/Hda family protein [Tateyamaria omphalii]APX10994.1 chromosomal replication initiator DnaA [Tateyamaria omphalii]